MSKKRKSKAVYLSMLFESMYNIEKTLSDSNKSTVFKARSKANGNLVVVRVLYDTNMEFPNVLRGIDHPYIAKIHDVIQDGSDVIIVEEYIEGVTLKHFLDEGGQLSEEQIRFLLSDLCRALSAIHNEGIIHRDIKPSNIILRNGRAILIDFDVARKHNSNQSLDTVYMGTKGYAAPEQFGFAQTDNRSDIYSLGVLIKELLGGRYDTVSYKNMIDKCVQFDPGNRYQSVQEIMADFNRPSISQDHDFSGGTAKAVKSQVKNALKILGYITMAIYLVVILQRSPHEVTALDFTLSKMVYVVIILLLFAPVLNFFKIRKWFPFIKSKKNILKTLGIIIYIFAAVLVIVIANSIANAFYSQAAKEILSNLS